MVLNVEYFFGEGEQSEYLQGGLRVPVRSALDASCEMADRCGECGVRRMPLFDELVSHFQRVPSFLCQAHKG